MSVQELPTTRQRAWLLDGGAGHASSAPAAPAGAARWSARRAFKWAAVGLGSVAFFIAGLVLYLMVAVPDPTSYMG